MLIGCGLRRAELLALTLESIQRREEHWVIADLVGKGGHVRTVPIPDWVKVTVNAWTDAANITHGTVFRAINKAGRVWGDGMSPKVLWDEYGQRLREPALTSWPRTISGARVRGSVTWLAANWIRSDSCWGTSRSRRRNAILDASSDCDAPSTTALESSQTPLDRFGRGADDGKRLPFATDRYFSSSSSSVVCRSHLREREFSRSLSRWRSYCRCRWTARTETLDPDGPASRASLPAFVRLLRSAAPRLISTHATRTARGLLRGA
jgi:hypothetical protein